MLQEILTMWINDTLNSGFTIYGLITKNSSEIFQNLPTYKWGTQEYNK